MLLAFMLIFSISIACSCKEVKEEATEEATLEEKEKPKGEYEERKIGQEFIYQGIRIILQKYETVSCSYLSDRGYKELYVYLYVKNINTKPHDHIYSYNFVLYHNGKKDVAFFGSVSLCEDRKMYDVGTGEELKPGEIVEGWISTVIPESWNTENLEVHFEEIILGTHCIWKL